MIRVQRADFNVGLELKKLTDGKTGTGGLCSFVGLVRDIHPLVSSQTEPAQNSKSNQSMTLEHYPGMTEKKLREIEQQACGRWDLTGSLIIHRFGTLSPGDQIVLVAAAARHRRATFEAAAFMMDYLKSRAPFWKLEEADGQGAWVDARQADLDALKKWG